MSNAINNPQSEDSGVINAWRSNDDRQRQRAIQQLVEQHLLPAACRACRNKRDQIDLQPESVVLSVIAHELDAAIVTCKNESHLRGRLVLAVQNKIRDRLKKGGRSGRPIQSSQPSDDGIPDPSISRIGPATWVAETEAAIYEEKAFQDFTEIILSQAGQPTDAKILKGFVLEGKAWEEVASKAGLSSAPARKRLSRLRKTLLAILVDPLRCMIDGEAWAVAESMLVARAKPTATAAAVQLPERTVQRIFTMTVLPALVGLYGRRGLESLQRLIG